MSSTTASANQYSSMNPQLNSTSTFLSKATNSSNNSNTLSSKAKCTRSKSQPVFNKDNNNNNYASIPSSESQKASIYGCSSFKAPPNTFNLASQTNKKNLTSSPICGINETENANAPLIINENIQNDSSNAESSFYEDQLDNELESFSDSTGCLTVRSTEMHLNNKHFVNSANKIVKIIPPNNSNDVNTEKSSEISKQNALKSTQKKSGNSNHHVSFNINNAIYTSRQETPIPISILKQSITHYSNTSNNKSILANANTTTFEQINDSGKKVNLNDKDRTQNGSKGARSDSKTTIL